MPKNGACNLGSINLSEFVLNPFTNKSYFDMDSFIKAVRISVEALDTVLDENMNNHPLQEQREMAQNYRNIGLGIMGMHDMLIKLGITYGSKKSIELVDTIMNIMFKSAVIKSSELAKEKGAFPMYKKELLNSRIIRKHFTEEEIQKLGLDKNGLRNCSLLSIAPTGTLGTMFNISTGCEPLFALSYNRKTESLNDGKDKVYVVYTKTAKEYIDKFNTKNLPEYFNTSKNVNWKARIDMQSVLQKHVDTAISSTVNLPNECSVEEIEQLYLYAWEKGLKGVTIFRDGCKRAGILTTKPKEEEKSDDKENNELPRGFIIKANDNCIGKKRTLTTGCGTLHCTAFFDPITGDLLETYLSKGSNGGCLNSFNGLSRMISLSARAGVDIYSIVDQLKSSGSCPSYASRSATKHDTSKGSSCPVAVGNALMDMYKEMKRDLGLDEDEKADGDKKVKVVIKKDKKDKPTKIQPKKKVNNPCPVCGSELNFEGGCNICKNCGWSKCD